MSNQAETARRIQQEHADQIQRRRDSVQLLGGGAHNDFEMLAVMAALSGWVTRSRAAEMIGVTLAEYRQEVEPGVLELLRRDWPEMVARELEGE